MLTSSQCCVYYFFLIFVYFFHSYIFICQNYVNSYFCINGYMIRVNWFFEYYSCSFSRHTSTYFSLCLSRKRQIFTKNFITIPFIIITINRHFCFKRSALVWLYNFGDSSTLTSYPACQLPPTPSPSTKRCLWQRSRISTVCVRID